MLLRLLQTGQMLAAQAAGTVLDLEIVPEPGAAFLMFSGAQIVQTRGKFINKGAGMTSIQPKLAPTYSFGGTPSLDANLGGAISSTAMVLGAGYGLPFLRLDQAGTSSASSDMELVLGLGFQVRAVIVKAANAGLGYTVGQDLAANPDVRLRQ